MALKSQRPPSAPSVDSEWSLTGRSSRAQDVRSQLLEQKLKDLDEELVRERRIGVAMREVGLALGTTLDLDELLNLILAKITDAVEADRATLYLLDGKGELVSRVMQGGQSRQLRLKVGQGIAGAVAQTSKTLLVNDPYNDPRFNPAPDLAFNYRTRSILAVPMKNHLGRTIGVVQVLNKKTGPFNDHDAITLAALSTQASIAIDNSRLFLSVTQKNAELLDIKEQLEHRVRDLKLLFDLESAMGRATSLEELFTGVLTEALRTSGATAAAFAMKAGEGIQLYMMFSGDEKLHRHPLRAGQGLAGAAIADGDVIFTNEPTTHPAYEPETDDLLGQKLRGCIAVPLEGEDGDAMGAIALYNKARIPGSSPRLGLGAPREDEFNEEDRALLLLIAANASTAIRLQMAREQREREERLTSIGRLMSGVIHDLKTPLTVISGYVQMMKIADKRPLRDEYAELALKQFEHIGSMMRDVLEFARGERNLLVRKVYLNKFFGTEVREQLTTQLAKSGVELVVDVQDKGTAKFDEGKILRVVHNLARNAAEAMGDKGGKFTIKVTRSKPRKKGAVPELVVSFSDTGPGIPKEIEHRLFQSFVTSGKKGGTGLGLAITARIAEEHGGSIGVKSSPKGVTFTLRLPQPKDEK
ncbi:MAG: GAF domain-containing protein [Labilithrix sp.]|nr:GAF domain-containing protein [Labilithrix sp.]MCW5811177.1 GAF domain-containing protein [Labilithrix sp.]